ncbi:hypothetical protein [uncultured Roseobacter sp.]|uniref:hypothetical protein n=1 Tax=uncultured Roseobacter sp. TaxID=114847 RepID=UPI00262FF2EA|nr:hypothetical protein [uncultured Roseobacter sp.]
MIDNIVYLPLAPAMPDNFVFCSVQCGGDIVSKRGAFLDASKGKSVLLQRPVDIPEWELWARLAKVAPRSRDETPCSNQLRGVEPNNGLRSWQCVVKKAWTPLEYPRVRRNDVGQFCFDFPSWPLFPAAGQFDRIE